MKPNYTKPALIGGAVMGVLSALPIVSAGNLCCCLWVLCGGALAAYLLQQDQQAPITLGDGALAGLLAGIFGAFVMLVLSIPIMMLFQPFRREVIDRVLEQAENVPPWLRDALTRGGFSAMLIAGQFLISLVFGSAFSTLGGIVGAAMFQKKLPPGTIDVPPVPSV
jgi:hypothetical protein